MKVYEEKEIPARKYMEVKTRKCDLCGAEADDEKWESESYFNVNETEIRIEIRQKEGFSCSDGGGGTKYEIDLCPDCFKNKLVPWLKSQGADIECEDWDW